MEAVGPPFHVWDLFRDFPQGAEVIQATSEGWVTNRFSGGEWDDPEMEIRVGSGCIVFNPEAQSIKQTLVGRLSYGRVACYISAGRSIIAGPAPVNSQLTTAFGFPAIQGMVASTVTTHGVIEEIARFDGMEWVPTVPETSPSHALILDSPVALVWIREFKQDREDPGLLESAMELRASSLSISAGAELQLHAVSNGFFPSEYHWYRAGKSMGVTTNSVWIVPSMAQGDFGPYYVEGRIPGRTDTVAASQHVWITDSGLGETTTRLSRSGGHYQIRSSNLRPGKHLLESSSDLVHWKVMGAGPTDPDGNREFSAEAGASGQQFFRARAFEQ